MKTFGKMLSSSLWNWRKERSCSLTLETEVKVTKNTALAILCSIFLEIEHLPKGLKGFLNINLDKIPLRAAPGYFTGLYSPFKSI